MKQYLELLRRAQTDGELRPTRTGVDAYSIFGHQLEVDLQHGFPLLTTKKIHFPSIVHELLWFIKGDTNIKYLNDNKVTIWDEWADKHGDLGPIYGKQWRSWYDADGNIVDQLSQLITALQDDPYSRRHIISAWNPGDLPKMALAPCHIMFQFFVSTGGSSDDSTTANQSLSCHLYQRSADVFLGVPFNIASYSLLTIMLAHCLGMKLGKFVHSFGDAHIYANHLEQADEQLSRQPESLPQLQIDPEAKDLFSITAEDIKLTNYNPQPMIKAAVAV